MMDYVLANFNWPTFFIALGVFALVSSLFNVILSYIRLNHARQDVKSIETEFTRLRKQLKAKDKELDEIILKRGK